MDDATAATPAMAQWFAAKTRHPDALLFFRMGDFYELFFADAERAAAALDIQLTQRGSHAGRPINMCGVPVHAAEAYLARLIRRGFRVAVVEQMEDAKSRPAHGKAPLRRAVVRLVTPGTLIEEALLDPARANLLLAFAADAAGGLGAAWVDMSTGRFETEQVTTAEIIGLLGRIDPAEIICPSGLDLGDWQDRRAPNDTVPTDADRAEAMAGIDGGEAAFAQLTQPERAAAVHVLVYVRLTQAGALPNLSPPRSIGVSGILQMDAATRASLEITSTRDGATGLSLLGCVRRTLTASGARLLAERLSIPVTDLAQIVARQDGWSWLLERAELLERLRAALRQAPDLARALGRMSLGRHAPRDLAALRDGLGTAAAVAVLLHVESMPPEQVRAVRRRLDMEPDLAATFARGLAPTLPARLEDGGVIADGFDGELDALRALRDDSRAALAGLQLDLAQRYGVASLKIRHHQQLGYVIEVPAASVERLRALPELIFRQSLANAARFSSVPLAELDRRIAQAGEQAAERERGIVGHLVRAALVAAEAIRDAAAALAEIDVAQSCAKLAESDRWCRPRLTQGAEFCIEAGRHPVVEAARAGVAAFIANDCDLSPARRVLLLTGPNMAGKSTYLRQNALIVLLAQAGLPVPARAACIGIVDRLFCRVGAADDLARGRSTFMVEMTEAAAILRQAGPQSLVIIDEIGRGTATLDGLAIAWAILETLHTQVRVRTIFATHFHELARLRHELPHLCPHTMRVKEWRGDVVFLHEVAEGAGGRSWGVQVAKLAAVPAPVVRRAAAILAALEARHAGLTQAAELPLFASVVGEAEVLPSLVQDAGVVPDALRQALGDIEPDLLSPKQALDALYHLKSLEPPSSAVEPADRTH